MSDRVMQYDDQVNIGVTVYCTGTICLTEQGKQLPAGCLPESISAGDDRQETCLLLLLGTCVSRSSGTYNLNQRNI